MLLVSGWAEGFKGGRPNPKKATRKTFIHNSPLAGYSNITEDAERPEACFISEGVAAGLGGVKESFVSCFKEHSQTE